MARRFEISELAGRLGNLAATSFDGCSRFTLTEQLAPMPAVSFFDFLAILHQNLQYSTVRIVYKCTEKFYAVG